MNDTLIKDIKVISSTYTNNKVHYRFSNLNQHYINCFNIKLLSIFMTNKGFIKPWKKFKIKKKYYNKIVKCIKRARQIGILPYVMV